MPIRFSCPNGHRLIVPNERAGKKGKCPECRVRVYVPLPAGGSADLLPPQPPGARDDIDDDQAGGDDQIALETDEIVVWQAAPLAEAPLANVPLAEAPLAVAPPDAPPPLPAAIAYPADGANVPAVDSDAAPAVVAMLEEPLVDRPDAGKLQTVYMLSLGLIALALFGAAPAIRDLNVITAPGWVWVVMLTAALQIVYVAWMLSLPDWSTVWIGMIVYAAAAAVYGLGWALLGLTPADNEINLLGLDGLDRGQAAGWCAAIALLTLLMTYACGRVSSRWRRAWELQRGNAELEEKSEVGGRNSQL